MSKLVRVVFALLLAGAVALVPGIGLATDEAGNSGTPIAQPCTNGVYTYVDGAYYPCSTPGYATYFYGYNTAPYTHATNYQYSYPYYYSGTHAYYYRTYYAPSYSTYYPAWYSPTSRYYYPAYYYPGYYYTKYQYYPAYYYWWR